DVWQFALYSGCRNEEIQNIRVEDIKDDYLVCRNIKASNLKGFDVFRYVLLTDELLALVKKLSADLKSDDYLLVPNESNRRNVMNISSRAFSHYTKAISDEPLRFKDLRNTYTTEMIRNLGATMAEVLGDLHSDFATTKYHYLNKEEIFKANKGIRLFGTSEI
ncbi:MAG: site-specific integrase, partial [Cyclobacteriaceae bacterium]